MNREHLRERLAEKIRAACPSDDQCNEDMIVCLRTHPIHTSVTGPGGVITEIYAEVDGLLDLIMETIEEQT